MRTRHWIWKSPGGYYIVSDNFYVIPKWSSHTVKTGIVLKIPENSYGEISGMFHMAKKGLMISSLQFHLKCELVVVVHNISNDDICIKKDQAYAKLFFHKTVKAAFQLGYC